MSFMENRPEGENDVGLDELVARLVSSKRSASDYLAVAVVALVSSGTTLYVSPGPGAGDFENYRQANQQLDDQYHRLAERIIRIEKDIEQIEKDVAGLPPEWLRRELKDVKEDLKNHKH